MPCHKTRARKRWLSVVPLSLACVVLAPMPGRASPEEDHPPLWYDPNHRIRALADFLAAMEVDLMTFGDDASCARLQAGVPTHVQGEPDMEITSPAILVEGQALVADGGLGVVAHQSDGTVDLVLELEDGGTTRWTLVQTMWLDGDTLHLWGTLEVFTVPDGGVTYTGGWTYSAAAGALEDPDSEPGFHAEVENMFRCTPLTDGADGSGGTAQFGIGSLASLIGNVVTMAINYIRDLFIPYTPPPDDCEGPSISDGPGESCENVNIPCTGDFGEMCGKIDQIPDTSDGFKQCMKGRCGCGGSSHPRARITCDDADDCGPCAGRVESAGGCSLGGSLLWYCSSTSQPCLCVNAVFHEMSHACGALDLIDGSRDDAYRIGDWFDDECDLLHLPPARTLWAPDRQ